MDRSDRCSVTAPGCFPLDLSSCEDAAAEPEDSFQLIFHGVIWEPLLNVQKQLEE